MNTHIWLGGLLLAQLYFFIGIVFGAWHIDKQWRRRWKMDLKERNRQRALRVLCPACMSHFNSNDGEVIIDELCTPCREKCIRLDIMHFTSEEE